MPAADRDLICAGLLIQCLRLPDIKKILEIGTVPASVQAASCHQRLADFSHRRCWQECMVHFNGRQSVWIAAVDHSLEGIALVFAIQNHSHRRRALPAFTLDFEALQNPLHDAYLWHELPFPNHGKKLSHQPMRPYIRKLVT